MLLSYLYAQRLKWYGEYGYRPWSRGTRVLHSAGGAGRSSGGVRRYDAASDRGGVERLWRRYAEGAGGAPLDGIVHRDAEDWRGRFRLAGNPEEDIRVAERAGSLRAYLRVAVFEGRLRVLEWGREANAPDGVRDLLAAALAAGGARSIRLPLVRDPEVERLVAAAGGRIEALPAWDEAPPEARPVAWMVRSLDDEALADRLGLAREGDVLARCLPPERFAFWDADRF